MSALGSGRTGDPHPTRQCRRVRWLLAAAIAVLTLSAYSGVRQHEFVDFDDQEYVVANPGLDRRLELADVWRAFAKAYNSNWAPITSLSLAVSDALHGPAPGAHAFSNVLLHTLASILLLFAFGRATDRWAESAFVAAVFAVHPLHVESVAWISERKEVLAGVFWMAALAAYPDAVRGKSRSARALVLCFGLLAMLSKATAVALPITLLLFDLWPLDRLKSANELRQALAEKWLLIAAAVAVSVITFAVQTDAGANSTALTSLPLRILNAARAYAIYLAESFWPARLAYFYPFPSDAVLRSPASWAALVGVATLTALALHRVSRHPMLTMGWLWFLLTLVPMIGIVRVGGQGHADRYSYIAQTGLAVMLAFGLPDALAAGTRGPRAQRAIRRACAIAGVACIVALAWTARQQVAVWRDSITLFSHAVDVTSNNAHAHRFLGVSLWSAGDREGGARHIHEALRINPDWGDARLVWVTALLQQDRLDEAARELAHAARDGAEPALVLAATGVLAERRGDAAAAASAYEQSLREDPDDWEVLNNLAWIRAANPDPALRDPARAVGLAQRAAQKKPDHAFVQGTLAAAYAGAGRMADAVSTQERALAILRAQGDLGSAAAFSDRLEAYRAGRRPWQSE